MQDISEETFPEFMARCDAANQAIASAITRGIRLTQDIIDALVESLHHKMPWGDIELAVKEARSPSEEKPDKSPDWFNLSGLLWELGRHGNELPDRQLMDDIAAALKMGMSPKMIREGLNVLLV